MVTVTETKFLDKFFAVSENIGKIVALVSGIVLSLSVFYDYNFLQALGLSFGDVPTSIADHVRSAILWLPPALFTLFASLLAGLLTPIFAPPAFFKYFEFPAADAAQAETANPRDGDAKSTLRRKGVQYARNAVVVVLAFMLFAVIVVAPLNIGYTIGMIVWVPFSTWLLYRLSKSLSLPKISKVGSILFIGIPILVAAVGKSGYNDGRALGSTHAYHVGREVLIKTDEGRRSCTVLGIRRFSFVAIVAERDGEAVVVPAEQVLMVRPVYGVEFDKDASSCLHPR